MDGVYSLETAVMPDSGAGHSTVCHVIGLFTRSGPQPFFFLESPSSPFAMALGEIGGTSQVSVATPSALPSHSSPFPTDVSQQGAVAPALQDIPPANTLSYSLEGTMQ